ncbi:MAG: hypothetical protein J6J57_07500 [Alistipes sp.]|nr:hypothetical protein [Alistipes sp.]
MISAKDFQDGDYIKYQSNRVLKITDAVNMQAIDVNGNTVLYSNGCCPNIGLDDEVLQICGFTQEGSIWKHNIGDSTIIRYNDGVCKLRNPYKGPQDKDLCVLSILQDFVRDYTGKELPINHQTLAEYIRNL